MASRHDRKRAERFEAAGVGEADLPYAQTAYMGAEDSACCLCDTPIKYQYLLTFSRPAERGGSVELFPVGSQCITDWMKAMPESVARSEAIRRVKAAEAEMRRQRKVLKRLEEDGDEDAATLMRLFFRLPKDVQDDTDKPLGDIGKRVTRYGSFLSDNQRRFFARLVREAARAAGIDDRSRAGSGRQPAQPAPEAAPAPAPEPSACADDPEGAELLRRWAALSADARDKAPEAAHDIAGKVERYGSFASDNQRRFFAGLVDAAEAVGRWLALPDAARGEGALGDIGGRLLTYGKFASPRQRGFFMGLLKKAEEAAGTPPPPPAPEATQAELFEDEGGEVPAYMIDEDDEEDPF